MNVRLYTLYRAQVVHNVAIEGISLILLYLINVILRAPCVPQFHVVDTYINQEVPDERLILSSGDLLDDTT